MTSTATKQAVSEWCKIFPKGVVENYTSSVNFMKQLTVIAVSTITFIKNIFPPDCFMNEYFHGLKLKILKRKCGDELAQFLSTALIQAFDAFDKKYLHRLALCFYEDECKPDNLIEYHIFEYKYNKDAVTMSVHSKGRDRIEPSMKYTLEDVEKSTLSMIRTCVVFLQQRQQPLPSEAEVSIRLYYNEDAPDGYQPPGFQSTDETSEDDLESQWAKCVKLGSVETPYHKMAAHSYVRFDVGGSHEAVPSQNPPMMTQMEQEDIASLGSANRSSEESSLELQCPCNKYEGTADDEAFITCREPLHHELLRSVVPGYRPLLHRYCNTRQHAACFGVSRAAAARITAHCCARCADEDAARSPTDPRLARTIRESLCMLRRVVWWLARATPRPRLSGGALVARFGVSSGNAARLLKLLHSYGVIDGDHFDLTTPKNVIVEKLESIYAQHFPADDDNIVDRLAVETLSPQGIQPDPIGEALGPSERVTLHNTLHFGRVIDNTDDFNRTPIVDDATLKQYKEAMSLSDAIEEELPLSGSHNPIKDVDKISKMRSAKRKLRGYSDENKPMQSGIRTKRAKMRGK